MKIFGIIFFIVFFGAFSFFVQKSNYQDKEIPNGTIWQPRLYLYIGIFGIIGFVTVGLIFILAQDDVVSGIVMFAVAFPYIFFVLYACNWKIVFDDNGFLFTNIIGKQRQFLYKDITMEDTGRGLRIYCGKKKITTISYLLGENVGKFYRSYKKNGHNK